MIEKNYNFNKTDKKIVERIVDDENINLNHMVLIKGTGMPEHYSNSNVYMVIIRGTMTLKLGDQEPKKYRGGDIVNIPYGIKMNIDNFDDEVLEFFVVKSPSPKNYRGE
ncbi:MAG: cupin domain-containing protein [Tepidanaerobacteraceae bacterium]|nr:cupin domain-containing protein [Tepidanaerobacteraceae bacterium]